MPKDGFNGSGITYKADMFLKNTFSVPTSWSFLIIYEPSWYEAGYFQFYTYVDSNIENKNNSKLNLTSK
jgi:hypothetical protein